MRSISGLHAITLFLRPPRRRRTGAGRAAVLAFAGQVLLAVLAALLIAQLAGVLLP